MGKNSSFLSIALLLGVVFAGSGQAQMKADIREDVTTPFGVYHPHLVTVIPAVQAYEVAPDFGNVVNFDRFSFSPEERSLLAANGFVVTPGGNRYNEIYDIYNECRELGLPIFVTTDALLHTFHLCFDYILMTLEQERFFSEVESLLDGLEGFTLQQLSDAADPLAQEALRTNLNYLVVARTLLDTTYVPPVAEGPYLQELDLIRNHNGFDLSPISGYQEDYSQYIPRGHYTRTDSLQRYFRAMMWLGRMTFAADDTAKTLAALLLVQALANSQVGGEAASDVWQRVYEPTVFFVGKSDDLDFRQYAHLADIVYGDGFELLPPDTLATVPKLAEYVAQLQLLPGPKITYPGQPKGWRLMGQRFVPDSYMLDQLVYPHTARFMPRGLDVMSVLGSARAEQILDELYHEFGDPSYLSQMAKLKSEFETQADSVWAQNLYWNWLYSLMPLLFAKGEGYPPFMQNDAWVDKELFAALGSWGELRHDTILYAKQSGTETGFPPESPFVQGYVEPNPHLYARLASLADLMLTGLGMQGLLDEAFEPHLTRLRELLLDLKTISEKELTNRALTPQEYELIVNIGETLEWIAEFAAYPLEGSPPNADPMAVVADVHTDANTNTVLEEGVGYPLELYVIVQLEGQLLVTRGAAFSYYEFTVPIQSRLTDEAWNEMLKGTSPPAPPVWTDTFIPGDAVWAEATPETYFWHNRGLQAIWIETDTDSLRRGEVLEVRVVLPGRPGTGVSLQVPRDGHTSTLSLTTDSEAIAYAQVATAELGRGHYWLEATVMGSTYRIGFVVLEATGVETEAGRIVPGSFELDQNRPNPFSPDAAYSAASDGGTTISYRISTGSPVVLQIYNLLGQRVRTLVHRVQSPGRHAVRWDGKDDSGRDLSAGIYYYRLTIEGSARTKRLVLLR